ncbi:putative protease [Desulfobaculum xiamenense]|uniref:Putative protease n=1 Tax=Desulfobaculum xiamenense TaxID=995050 RepID=A0A846QQD2_9BACT|nr:peptidase U32 family protein [Desulfobaculum xiamenense]NJB68712.1 putative protease [Desulfobaculum xiamenense]
MTPRIPELLAPAGNLEKLETAILYGARAVYLGGPAMNLRAQSAGFGWQELAEAITLAHASGVAAYLCLNALPRQQDLPQLAEAMDRVADMADAARPDALIIADPGVLMMARRRLPHIPVHLSTQANTANSESAAFWREFGVTRVNLARELGLRGIRDIAHALPGLELEVFAHGAMCMAVSGRCVLSAHMNARSANLGQCTHPCRFNYAVRAVAVEERTRPGELAWEIHEEDGWSSILAAEDLCLVKFAPWFARTGVSALKIEGRMKSGGYLAQVLDAYATALTDFAAGTFRPAAYLAELTNTASRPLTTGFFLPGDRRISYPRPEEPRPVLARVTERIDDDAWTVAIRSKWDATAPVRVIAPGLKRPMLSAEDYALENELGERVVTGHSGTTLTLRAAHPALRKGLFLRS